MPRKVAVEKEPVNNDDNQTVCYLDSFLQREAPPRTAPTHSNRARLVISAHASFSCAGVTEDSTLPGDVKRALSQLRDLDSHGQELFERVQKYSKNHVARAKRSVQSGQTPDEELLHKARKSHRELMEIDEEKVAVADEVCAQITKELLHCESELHKFADELKERGQLKNPIIKVRAEPAESGGHPPL